jgi:hypothetical protein
MSLFAGPRPEWETFVSPVNSASFIADYLLLSARIESVLLPLPVITGDAVRAEGMVRRKK